MDARNRGSALICLVLCVTYAIAGGLACWQTAGPAQAADGLAGPTADVGAAPFGLRLATAQVPATAGDAEYHLTMPVSTHKGLNHAVLDHLAGAFDLPPDLLAQVGEEGGAFSQAALPADSQAAVPVDSQNDSETEGQGRRATVVNLTCAAYCPAPGTVSFRFARSLITPGAGVDWQTSTMVYDLQAERVLSLADLIGCEQSAGDRLAGLLEAKLHLSPGPRDATTPVGEPAVPLVEVTGFVLTREAVSFEVLIAGVEGRQSAEVSLSYREMTGLLAVRLGYPWASGQAYPAYIEVSRDGGEPRGNDAPAIALTFDDGPTASNTRTILGELSKRGAVGTFCVIGVAAYSKLDILQDIVLQGSEIGNHTWNHWDLTLIPAWQVWDQVARLQRLVTEATRVTPAFVRPPAGKSNAVVRAQFGVPAVFWSIDPKDWAGATSFQIASHVIERAKDGDIVLLHDTAEQTVAAVGMILDELGARGFRFVTVSELLNLRGGSVPAGSIWRSRAGP